MKNLVRYIAGLAIGAGVMGSATAAPVVFDFTAPLYGEARPLEYVDNGIGVSALGWAGESLFERVTFGPLGLGVQDRQNGVPIDPDAAIDSDGRLETLNIEFDFDTPMYLTGVAFGGVLEGDIVNMGFFNADMENDVAHTGVASDGLGIGTATCADTICSVQLDEAVSANYFQFGNLGGIEYYSFYVVRLEFDDGLSVPAPGMAGIFGLGLLAVGLLARRRVKAA